MSDDRNDLLCGDITLRQAPGCWTTFQLGTRQVAHLKMLCKFHLAESRNEQAKAMTKKLLYCLERWPKPLPHNRDSPNPRQP